MRTLICGMFSLALFTVIVLILYCIGHYTDTPNIIKDTFYAIGLFATTIFGYNLCDVLLKMIDKRKEESK